MAQELKTAITTYATEWFNTGQELLRPTLTCAAQTEPLSVKGGTATLHQSSMKQTQFKCSYVTCYQQPNLALPQTLLRYTP